MSDFVRLLAQTILGFILGRIFRPGRSGQNWRGAGFQTCCLAVFQIGRAAKRCGIRGFGNPRYSRLGSLRYRIAYEISRLGVMPFGYSQYESQRDSAPKPSNGVATKELPWVNPPMTTNPNGVAAFPCLSAILNFRKTLRLGVLFLGMMGAAAAELPQNPWVTNTPVPKHGGTLRLALPTDVSSLDPALAFDSVFQPFLMLLYQGLVEYGEGANLVPGLAQNWTVSADLRRYTFHLRSGSRFSNGREVEAADFVFTLERNLDPKLAGLTESFFEGIAGAKEFRAGKAPHVCGLRAPHSDTLEIELEKPDPAFLYILTLPGALVVPHEAVEKFGSSFTSHPVGTGPYVLTQWRRGAKMRFERNPLFSQPDRQYLDAIEVMEGGNSALWLMMFERGELDIADIYDTQGIPTPDFTRIQRSPRWQGLIESIPTAVTAYVGVNTEMPPFDQLKVRQAMNYAIDKNKIVKLMHNTVVSAMGVLPPPMPGFNPNLVGYQYDPAKARQLLAESGHADGFSFKFWCLNTDVAIATAIQYDLAQVGIKAQLNLVSLPALSDSTGRRRTVQCCFWGWGQDYPDPSDFLDTLFNGNRITEEGSQNVSFYNNPKVNALLTEAATCSNPERRLHLYQAVEQTVVTDAPLVPLFFPRQFALHQPWLHGVHLHPVLYYRFERMWIDPETRSLISEIRMPIQVFPPPGKMLVNFPSNLLTRNSGLEFLLARQSRGGGGSVFGDSNFGFQVD